MKLTLALGMALAIGSPAITADENDVQHIAGGWKLVGLQQKGDAIPADQLPAVEAKFDAEGHGTLTTPKGEVEGSFTLEPSATPPMIDIQHETGPDAGAEQFGVYKLSDNELRLCLAPPGAPRTDRPGDFDTTHHNGTLLTFERLAA